MAALIEFVETGERWPLRTSEDNVIGRGEADIFTPDYSVTRRHTNFRRTLQGWEAVDFGSSNGTQWSDGGPFSHIHTHALRSGDLLLIGKLKVRFIIDDSVELSDESWNAELFSRLKKRLELGDETPTAEWLMRELTRRGFELSALAEVARAASRSPSSHVRRTAARVLAPLCRLPRSSAECADAYLSLLADPDPTVRSQAVSCGAGTVAGYDEVLLNALADPAREVFDAAVKVLGSRADLQELVEALVERTPPDRRKALEDLIAVHRRTPRRSGTR